MTRLLFLFSLLILPCIANASEEASVSGFWYRLLAFTMFIGIMYLLFGKTFSKLFSNMRENTIQSLENAKKTNEEAQIQYEEYLQKMSQMDQELEKMKIAAKSAVEKEVNNIMLNAEEAAARLRELTKNTIENEFLSAQNKLRKEISKQLIDKTESLLSSSDRQFHNEYINNNVKDIMES